MEILSQLVNNTRINHVWYTHKEFLKACEHLDMTNVCMHACTVTQDGITVLSFWTCKTYLFCRVSSIQYEGNNLLEEAHGRAPVSAKYAYAQTNDNLPTGLRWMAISGSGTAFKELKQGGRTILCLTQYLLPWECLEFSDICTAQDRVETEWAESLYFRGNYLINSFKYIQSTVWLAKALWSKWFVSTPCKMLSHLLSWRWTVSGFLYSTVT